MISFGLDSSGCFTDVSEFGSDSGLTNAYRRIGKSMTCSGVLNTSAEPIQNRVEEGAIEAPQGQTMDRRLEPTTPDKPDIDILSGDNTVDVDIKPDLNHIRLNLCTLFLHIQCCVR